MAMLIFIFRILVLIGLLLVCHNFISESCKIIILLFYFSLSCEIRGLITPSSEHFTDEQKVSRDMEVPNTSIFSSSKYS